jgi:hydroxyacyl-ACP dehydratase HTD2-like protein with hotdog domain
MKQTKISRRINWINEHRDAIDSLMSTPPDHSQCKGTCKNGANCKTQSGGGWGFWAQAFAAAGIQCYATNYWSGSAPTPSTSIDRRLANYITTNAPEDIR